MRHFVLNTSGDFMPLKNDYRYTVQSAERFQMLKYALLCFSRQQCMYKSHNYLDDSPQCSGIDAAQSGSP